MKKLLSLILCGTMVLSFASCGSSKSEETLNTTSETTTTASKSTEAVVTGEDFDPDFTFRTTDRLGNEWTETAFAANKLTMINFWEPWCGPCIGEMPDLQKLYDNYCDLGLLVVGVYSDTTSEADVDQILESAGTTYPILIDSKDFDIFRTPYVPTTVFIDRNGKVIVPPSGTVYTGGDVVIGSNSYENWESVILSLLGEQ